MFITFMNSFLSPGQARNGTGAIREPQLCVDSEGPGGAACKPHQSDRLPMPS